MDGGDKDMNGLKKGKQEYKWRDGKTETDSQKTIKSAGRWYANFVKNRTTMTYHRISYKKKDFSPKKEKMMTSAKETERNRS